MCVALSPPSQHAEGKYIVVNIHDGGKVSEKIYLIHSNCVTNWLGVYSFFMM